jgi:uncharacterized protein
MGHDALVSRLVEMVSATGWLMDALQAASTCVEVPWCIGAGTIRELVWDDLHGFAGRLPDDVDLAFFDAAASASAELGIAEQLRQLQPLVPWDVVNQAKAHLLSKNSKDLPFSSLGDAVAAWPETATAVGVWWEPGTGLRVLAPLGLSDLFGAILRASRQLRDPAVFLERYRIKRWPERYPKVQLRQP